MNRFTRIVLPVLVLGGCVALGVILIKTAPEAKRRPPKPVVPVVESITLQPRDYTVRVPSRGTVTPYTQSTLMAEVAGAVTNVAAAFRPGGFFERGEELLRIDPRDYETAITIARSDLAQATLTLQEEEAQGEQARQEWEKLGLSGTPSALTLRQPQLAHARAALAAARARLAQAETDLARTRIVAPFAGRLLEKQVDLGQFVSRGAPLATLYGVERVEVRLPISDQQAAFLDLPESFRGEGDAPPGPAVTLTATIGEKRYQWQGRIVRTEGAIDTQTRQITVVAQVADPYARHPDGRPPLKVGQFVEAAIQGHTLRQVFPIPREAMRGEGLVLVVTPDNHIQRRQVKVVWRDQETIVVESGLHTGERLSLTPLPYAPDGMTVALAGAPAKPDAPVSATGDKAPHANAPHAPREH